MQRRRFLETLAGLGVGVYGAPLAAQGSVSDIVGPRATRRASIAAAEMAASSPRERSLVLVELQGGNDGLNMVVPYRDPLYRDLRPTLALPADACPPLDDALALHPALAPLMPWWQRGDLAVVNGVGYPNPNRSHFRSIDIWETASGSDDTLVDGWLRSVVAALPARGTGIKGVAVDSDIGPFAGTALDSVAMTDLKRFVRQSRGLPPVQPLTGQANPAFAHIVAVERATRSAAEVFERSLSTLSDAAGKPAALRARLDTVASLMALELGPRLFKVTLGGFDTHVNQLGRHAALMAQLAEALAAFATRLDAEDHWQDTLVLTYSEFGRRAAQNGSAGTDHGAAAPQLVFGGRVRGGVHGSPPRLDRLENGDVPHDIDFRQLYSAAMGDWLGVSTRGTPLEGFEPVNVIG